MRSYLLPLQSKVLILVEQVSHPCRASLSSLQNKFLETWWASLGLRPVGGPRERMGFTFFGLVDMGLLGSPTGLLGLPSLISHFTLFSDLHPFKESCHLAFISDLHPSWQNLIT